MYTLGVGLSGRVVGTPDKEKEQLPDNTQTAAQNAPPSVYCPAWGDGVCC
jgi:hypothetical protein